jgi:hypothetical protein
MTTGSRLEPVLSLPHNHRVNKYFRRHWPFLRNLRFVPGGMNSLLSRNGVRFAQVGPSS